MSRLYSVNLHDEYPDLGMLTGYKSLGGRALLQKNYGQKNDCTLTSLAFLYGVEKYPQIEQIAMRYGYDGKKNGTSPFVVRKIMLACNKQFSVSGTCCVRYGKGISFDYETVKSVIDKGHYLLLNLWKDGRDYYKNHAVTVIGYEAYERGRFLIVFDNWNSTYSYIDYGKLSLISSVNWME